MATYQPAEATTYTAACHCRTIQLTFTLSAPLTSPSTMKVHCNCSICTRNGYLLCYPLRSEVVFPMQKQDPTKMGAYLLGSRRKPHYFCKTCGSSMWIDFQDSPFETEREMIAVNVSAFDLQRLVVMSAERPVDEND